MNDYDDETQAIERDMDIAEMKAKVWVLFAVVGFVGVGLLWYAGAHAQTTPQDFKTCSETACVQIIITPVVAPPVCPPKPADETQPGVCPAGTTGGWTKTQSYGSVAYPTCWVPSGFIPSSAPEGACVTPPPPPPTGQLTAPMLATPTHEDGTNAGRYNVILSWTAVPGATAYRIRRCVGPNCSTMSVHAANVTGTTYKNTNIPANTYKYQVEARRGTSEIGPASSLAVHTIPSTPPPPPPDPPPTGTGTASLTWERPTTNTDGSQLTNLAGFRIVYGTSQAQLTQLVQVPNAAAKTFTVDGLTPGTWYFAVRAYDSNGAESANSNALSKVVP